MSLLIFSILILVSNLLFFTLAIAGSGFVWGFMGGLAAILTDPVILAVGILGGIALATQRIKFPVISLVAGAVAATIIIHFSLGTTRLIVDVVRLDAFLLIPAIIILIAKLFLIYFYNVGLFVSSIYISFQK